MHRIRRHGTAPVRIVSMVIRVDGSDTIDTGGDLVVGGEAAWHLVARCSFLRAGRALPTDVCPVLRRARFAGGRAHR